MENYVKGANVEEPLDKSKIGIPNLPDEFLWMQVRGGSKIRNLLSHALSEFDKGKVVVWTGFGQSVGKAITCAEIMKKEKGHTLHQITKICYKTVEEYWDPQISEMDQIVVKRKLPMIHIMLTLDSVNKDELGYVKAEAQDAFYDAANGLIYSNAITQSQLEQYLELLKDEEMAETSNAAIPCTSQSKAQDILAQFRKDVKPKLKSDSIRISSSSHVEAPPTKQRKKQNRFDNMSEEEVAKLLLPDHIIPNLDILIVGINPGMLSAYKGHHYANPGNHFWKCLYLSGLTPHQMTAYEDYKLLEMGIGFTNMVARTTRGSSDLSRKELQEGSKSLLEKLQFYKPKIAVFNGKQIYEVFSGKKQFNFGKQSEKIKGTDIHVWVMPSSSARFALLPRAEDKLPYYAALKKFRDYLNGEINSVNESELVFSDLKIKSKKEAVKPITSKYFQTYQGPGQRHLYDPVRESKSYHPRHRNNKPSKTPTKEFADLKMDNRNKKKKFRNNTYSNNNADRSVNNTGASSSGNNTKRTNNNNNKSSNSAREDNKKV